jgi:hypothetical protein
MSATFKVDLRTFRSIFNAMKIRARYNFGAKANSLNQRVSDITGIDCSGFSQLALHRATGGAAEAPDGSQNQRDWCEQIGLHKLAKYSDVQYAARDNSRLFICFIRPLTIRKTTIKAGHVWFVSEGRTYESSTPTNGVGSRHWNQLVFRVRHAVAFELPTRTS